RVDRERRKLSLGLKQLAPSPWDTILDRYSFNSVVKGKVTRLTDFGAFVELSPQRGRRVADVVQPDQEVTAKVLNIDPGQRRISLSLKAATAPEEEAAEEEEAAAEGKPPRPRTTPLRGGLGR